MEYLIERRYSIMDGFNTEEGALRALGMMRLAYESDEAWTEKDFFIEKISNDNWRAVYVQERIKK